MRTAPRPRTSRVRRLAVVALLVPGALAVVGPSGAAPAPPEERELVYRGLTRATLDGPCRTEHGYEVVSPDGAVLGCTHGPDPAPQGVDVRRSRSVRELASARSAQGLPSKAGGAAAAAVPCVGDGQSGKRIQAVYAFPADRPDRYQAVLPLIRDWAAQIQEMFSASARETGGEVSLRFATDEACQLSVVRAPLSAAGDDTFANTLKDLRALGYDRSDRKYLVWMDATVYCGIASLYSDDRASGQNLNNGSPTVPGMVARVDEACWGRYPGSDSVEAHELVHTLGGVQSTAPNATPQGHCTDEWDLMCYADGGGVTLKYVCPEDHLSLLDCNHDDYFGTDPLPGSYLATHWNTAGSAFLRRESPPRNDAFAAAEEIQGSAGSVVGNTEAAGKEAGEPEHASNPGGASIWYRWTAPDSGSASLGTSGSGYDTLLAVYTGPDLGSLSLVAANDDAGGGLTSTVAFEAVAGTTYHVVVDGYNGLGGGVVLGWQVTTHFTLHVGAIGSGGGTITSDPGGIDCGATCVAQYRTGTPVTLTATPDETSEFLGWSGDCSGAGACTVTMSRFRFVVAEFGRETFHISVRRMGRGDVVSDPAGVRCPYRCVECLPGGTSLTLRAEPRPGWKFVGWTGACSGRGPCSVTLTRDLRVTAVFQERP